MKMLLCILALLVVLNSFDSSNATLVDFSRLPLKTQGTEIVDVNGENVKLACVNWYHAHMENYVVGGLHKQPLENLTQRVVDLGFNCVRLPFSLELVDKNAQVPDHALAANPSFQGKSGMELLDIVIAEFKAKGLLVVLNNHNSEAGWCCDVESPEGLWNVPGAYNTDEWIEILGNITARYEAEEHVVAFDLRNEIHDVGDTVITWGASDDKDTDWKVASQLAGARVLEEDPEMLIIVSGLCFGGDLRKLQNDPPFLPVENRLVWTTHTYGFSLWWRLIEEFTFEYKIWEIIMVVFIVGSTVFPVVYFSRESARESLTQVTKRGIFLTFASWSIVVGVLFLLAGILWREAMKGGGCMAMADGAYVSMGCGSTLILVGTIIILFFKFQRASSDQVQDLLNPTKEEGFASDRSSSSPSSSSCCLPGCKALNVIVSCVFFFILGVPGLIFARFAQGHEILEFDFAVKWVYEESVAPIWIGEFGGNTRDQWWVDLMQFLDDTDMDWAYWAYDGEKWENETFQWTDETYGILERDWETLRHPEMLQDMQGVQDPLK